MINLMRGYPRTVIVSLLDNNVAPPPGKGWCILSGIILHVTATPTVVYVMDKVTNSAVWRSGILSAEVSAEYCLYHTFASLTQSMGIPVIINNKYHVTITGDTGVLVRLLVIEFDE